MVDKINLSGEEFKIFLLRKKIVFTDLKTNMWEWLFFLKKIDLEPSHITYYNKKLHVIYCRYGVIKCIFSLGYPFDLSNQKPEEKMHNMSIYINKLELFVVKELNRSIYNYNLSTLGAIAVEYFKKTKEADIWAALDCETELKIKKAFCGGRKEVITEKFKDIKHLVYEVDFNNAYGNLLLGNFPTHTKPFLKTNDWDLKKPAFIEADVNQKFVRGPAILPIKNNGLFFKKEEFSGIFWHEELEIFIENGGVITKITGVVPVFNFKPIFKKRIEDLNNSIHNTQISRKKFLNFFYGRLALNPKDVIYSLDWEFKFENYLIDDDFLEVNFYKGCAIITKKIKNNIKPKTNYIVAAIITSRARINLYNLYKDLVEDGVGVFAMNTDAILIDREPSEGLYKKYDVKLRRTLFEDFF